MQRKKSSRKKIGYDEIIHRLKSLANPEVVEGMKRFGIQTETAYGVAIPDLRRLAGEIGTDHWLALRLWASGIHEARILAPMIDDLQKVTDGQMESWARGFDSWDVCDQCCSNLFDKTPIAHRKAMAWSRRKEEFVKRAGFVMMAALAVHDKEATDGDFLRFLPVIKRECTDDRNFVKKAVNWALRQIGKRNRFLNKATIAMAKEIQEIDSKSARWIALNALCELTSEGVQKRLRK